MEDKNIVKSTVGKTFYNKKGNECDEEHGVAYTVTRESTDTISYFIKEYCGNFFTADTVPKKSEVGRLKFRKVGPNSFAAYLKYLKTNLQSQYNLASRNIDE